jgi:hypothetical protein
MRAVYGMLFLPEQGLLETGVDTDRSVNIELCLSPKHRGWDDCCTFVLAVLLFVGCQNEPDRCYSKIKLVSKIVRFVHLSLVAEKAQPNWNRARLKPPNFSTAEISRGYFKIPIIIYDDAGLRWIWEAISKSSQHALIDLISNYSYLITFIVSPLIDRQTCSYISFHPGYHDEHL